MPLLWLSVAFLLGLLLAAQFSLPWTAWAGLAGSGVVLGLLEARLPVLAGWRETRRKGMPLPVGTLLAALMLGAARYQATQPVITPADLAWYNGTGKVRITAVVVEPPVRGTATIQLRLRASDITDVEPPGAPQAVEGLLQATLFPGYDWQYGDRLVLEGKLISPPENGTFSYRDYLARQGIFSYIIYPKTSLVAHDQGSTILSWIYVFRQRAYKVLNQIFPQPEAGLLSGILLGIDTDIPDSLVKAFQVTGTAHIIAISGFNIAILAGLFSLLAGRVFTNRWVALLASIAGISLYTAMVGASPSVVRAAIMGGVSLLGVQIGRRNSGGNALAFTAAVMCWINPLLPWDISFQLTSCATLGLVWFGVPLQDAATHLLERRFGSQAARRIAEPVSEYCLLTLAAQATTLPVIVYHFQRLSLSALIANPLVLPPQPLVMILGGIALLGGMLLLPLGKLLAALVWPLLAYTNGVVEGLATLRGGSIVVGGVNLVWIIVYFLALFLLAKYWSRLWKAPRQVGLAAGILAALLGSVGIWRMALFTPDGRLHLVAFPAEGGPSVLVETAEGRRFLVQAGKAGSELNSSLARRLPLFPQELDGLLLPGSNSSALDTLPDLLERFPPGWVLWNSLVSETGSGHRLQDNLKQAGVSLSGLETNQTIPLGKGASLQVLASGKFGFLLGLRWDAFRMILPGERNPLALEDLPQEWAARGSVLVLTDTSLRKGTSTDWLALSPLLVIAPASEVDPPGRWLGLDQAGWVELTTDGKQVWAESER